MEIGAPIPTFCGGGQKNYNFSPHFRETLYHSHSMHISVGFFSSDGMYSVLTILYNYLQMDNQITLFIKKKYFKILM